jgi:hypothetical protein
MQPQRLIALKMNHLTISRMKTPRFLLYLIILLAVWLPLNNAVAGAVITDCPMMSHALEQGVTAIVAPALMPHILHLSMPGGVSCRHNHGCDHCGVCWLLGAPVLLNSDLTQALADKTAIYSTLVTISAVPSMHDLPLRPPIN